MKPLVEVINQLVSLEQKLKSQEEFSRMFSRCKQAFEEMDLRYESPLQEKYLETRTDIEAHITGSPGPHMVITQVIKPIIFHKGAIIQKGIVIVENK